MVDALTLITVMMLRKQNYSDGMELIGMKIEKIFVVSPTYKTSVSNFT
jgi:hypothetical protein